MSAHLGDRDGEMMADINVTPFVDIVLVLLIILMVSSTEIIKSSLSVDLPNAASAGEPVDSTLNVVLTRDGSMYLDGAIASERVVAERIRAARAEHPGVRAVIAADRLVAYASVIDVIDLVRKNGVHHFALNVDREASR
jgi:biopolymer transport protein ExbD